VTGVGARTDKADRDNPLPDGRRSRRFCQRLIGKNDTGVIKRFS